MTGPTAALASTVSALPLTAGHDTSSIEDTVPNMQMQMQTAAPTPAPVPVVALDGPPLVEYRLPFKPLAWRELSSVENREGIFRIVEVLDKLGWVAGRHYNYGSHASGYAWVDFLCDEDLHGQLCRLMTH